MDDVHVWLGCFNPPFDFLLEDMQHKDGLGEAHGVDDSVSAAGIIFNNFQYAGTAKAP